MRAVRWLTGAALAVASAGGLLGVEPGTPEAPVGGTSDGWLEVARERTALRHAYVLGYASDAASAELVVVLSDRELSQVALESAAVRDLLASADEARSIVAHLPEGSGEIEVFFHHPRLPAGISLRGLAHFVPESVSAARLEGRLVLGGEGTTLEAWFSAPIVRRDRADPADRAGHPELAEAQDPAMSFEEALRGGTESELAVALAAGPDLERVGSSGMSALAIAADAGNAGAVRKLLEAGVQPDFRADRAAMSALMLAAGRASLDVVEALLAAGANPKLRTSTGFTPLLHAVLEGRMEIARRLIAAGADVQRDRESLLAMARDKGYAEMVALLEAPEAPVDAPPRTPAPKVPRTP